MKKENRCVLCNGTGVVDVIGDAGEQGWDKIGEKPCPECKEHVNNMPTFDTPEATGFDRVGEDGREWEQEFDEQFKGAIQLKNKPDGVTVTRLKHFIHQQLQKAREEEKQRIWGKLCDLAEPDERQPGAGDLNTHLDDVHKIIFTKDQFELDQPINSILKE